MGKKKPNKPKPSSKPKPFCQERIMLPPVSEMEAYIRQAAIARGIDPDVAVKVAKSEGLKPDTWQANGILSYGRERSYGPFQLHIAPKGHNPGLGNAFIRDTGLDPSDPANWQAGIDYALDKASKTGWADWFGAKNVGVGTFEGIGKTPVSNRLPPQDYGFSNPARPNPRPPVPTQNTGFRNPYPTPDAAKMANPANQGILAMLKNNFNKNGGFASLFQNLSSGLAAGSPVAGAGAGGGAAGGLMAPPPDTSGNTPRSSDFYSTAQQEPDMATLLQMLMRGRV